MRLMLTEAALLRRDRQQRRHPGHCSHGLQMKGAIEEKRWTVRGMKNEAEGTREEKSPLTGVIIVQASVLFFASSRA